ncbi:MAG TPA: alanine--tRNA ligase [Bacillota bacterium]|jgi:alanyl-tRNA synthetase
MSGDEIRQSFLDFFASKGHKVMPSASLVPVDDPTLLWINCGMAPLKPYFEERVTPPSRRLVSSQKSIRTNDIENVGKTPRHHTFFEMLGNFSIGDYFKEDAIAWAWELVTGVFELPADKLYVTVHPTDDEARQIWLKKVGLPLSRVLDDPSDFWDIGPGPCGPNSEIYIDRGEHLGCGKPNCLPGSCDCSRWLEFWNLVFTQFSHNEDGSHTPLPKKNIDTGMGLERIASILQGVDTNFETDLLYPIISQTVKLSGVPYKKTPETRLAMNVIADHLRSVTMTIGDGATPSNEGRGYILRRLLRRAVRYARTLGFQDPVLHTLVPTAAAIFAQPYPEIEAKKDAIARVIRGEEERFNSTLNDGMRIAEGMIDEARATGRGSLDGRQAFLLYDTYGFPFDLTEDIAAENGLKLDRGGFDKAMEEQRRRARAARQGVEGWDSSAAFAQSLKAFPKTEFVGYDELTAKARVLAIVKSGQVVPAAEPGEEVDLLIDRTPFYAESGGQVSDQGQLTSGESQVFEVYGVRKLEDGKFLHVGRVGEVILKPGMEVTSKVDGDRRLATARNHTATHLLQAALRRVLGDHVNQSGSYVDPDRLRFDFSHPSAMTREEVKAVEEMVNEKVLEGLPVTWYETSLAEAKAEGATALFGEKYGERVRVVRVGEFSQELCGGTHLKTAQQVGLFKVAGEGSVGSGLRRIEAVTGTGALRYVESRDDLLTKAAEQLRTTPAEVPVKIEELHRLAREKDHEIETLRSRLGGFAVDEMVAAARDVSGVMVVAGQVQTANQEGLRELADRIRDRLGTGVVIIGSPAGEGKVSFVSVVTKDLLGKGLNAGEIVREAAKVAGGGGGGRPDMAQAGGRHPELLEQAIARGLQVIQERLGQGH